MNSFRLPILAALLLFVAGIGLATVERAAAADFAELCTADAECDGRPDLYCNTDIVPNLCAFRLVAFSPCTRDAQCMPALNCVANVCTAPAGPPQGGENEPCLEITGIPTCDDGLECVMGVSEMRCARENAPEGMGCSPVGAQGNCAAGLTCEANAGAAFPGLCRVAGPGGACPEWTNCGGAGGVRCCSPNVCRGSACVSPTFCAACDAGDPAGICAGASLTCINGKCRNDATDNCSAPTGCINTGSRCTPSGSPTCCAGPAACQHNVFDGNNYCRAIVPPGMCIPLGQQCNPMMGIGCCAGVCNLGICVIPFNPDPPDPGPMTGIKLLEPIGTVTEIPTEGATGFGPFFFFFNLLYPWFLGLGAATAVLMGIVGGIQIMWSGGNDAIHSAGMQRFLLSLGGLVLLLFSSLILNLLNPNFFR